MFNIMIKKKLKKLGVTTLSATMLATGILPAISHAQDNKTKNNSISINSKKLSTTNLGTQFTEQIQKYYNMLSDNKKQEFNSLIKEFQLTENQQLQVLLDKEIAKNSPTPKWKLAIIKKAIKYAARILGTKLSEKGLADIIDYLTDFEDDLQTGFENAFVKYLHVSRTAAHWAAKTIMFIFF